MTRNGRLEPGDSFAGYTVTQVVEDHANLNNVIYRGTWDCCGREAYVSHKRLSARVRRGSRKCKECRLGHVPPEAQKLPKPPPPPYGVRMPLWAPTPIGLATTHLR
jgi:hypothetical protein